MYLNNQDIFLVTYDDLNGDFWRIVDCAIFFNFDDAEKYMLEEFMKYRNKEVRYYHIVSLTNVKENNN